MEIKLSEAGMATNYGGFFNKQTREFITHEPAPPDWESHLTPEDYERMASQPELYERVPVISMVALVIRYAHIQGMTDDELIRDFGLPPDREYPMLLYPSVIDCYTEEEHQFMQRFKRKIRDEDFDQYVRYLEHFADIGTRYTWDWLEEKGYTVIDDMEYVQRQLDGDDLWLAH